MLQFTRESEICYFKLPVMNEDIIGFDIPVNEVGVIEHLVPPRELPHEPPNQLLRAVAVVIDVVLEGAPIAVLHDEVEIVL
jgi:hypothetical protein